MIFDKISQKIKEMKQLKQAEDIKNNQKQQEIIDLKYRTILSRIDQLTKLTVFLKAELNFVLNETLYSKLAYLLGNSKDVAGSGFADKNLVDQMEIDYKEILDLMKKEWKKHYILITSETVSVLKIVSSINPDQVNKCLQKIKDAETWTANIETYSSLRSALREAENIIQDLNLDQEIIEFLQKMNFGKATISDLNEKVLEWIMNNSLDKKIKLSFK